MLNGKQLIIFDLDGTLIDSVGIWNDIDKELIAQLGAGDKNIIKNITDDIQLQRDAVLRQCRSAQNPYVEYCAFLKEKYRFAMDAAEIHAVRYRIAQTYLKNVVDYKKDADSFIRCLSSWGYQLVIATTTKRANIDIYRTQNKNIRAKANLDDYFTHIYTLEDVKQIKPNPEVYLRIMHDLDVDTRQCLVFEDSLSGVEAAKAAGMETVAIYDRYSDPDRDRINALADYKVENYTELLVSLQLV